jgi:predicted metal-binding membrane protein
VARLHSYAGDGAVIRVELLALLLRHRHALVLGALATVTAAAWAYLLLGAGIEMEIGGGQKMVTPSAWSPAYAALISVMWWVMMVAMMLPTAAPTVLLVTTLAWDRLPNPNLVPAAAMLFASGYLIVWCGFSLVATLLQWRLENAGLLSETMAFGNGILASTVLVAAGLYQWTPLKDACLRHCHWPTEFLTRHWRPGSLGAVGTGVSHGLFCLGGCWLFNGASVCRRIDEIRLGRRDRAVCRDGENHAMG